MYRSFIRYLIKSRYFWIKFGREIIEDLFDNHEYRWGQRLWAYRRGFYPYRITMYGLNNDNYRSYLNDWTYHRLQPINGAYSAWIDDKLTMKYILQPFDKFLPRYYFQLGPNGQVTKLMDCPYGCNENIAGVVELLEKEGCLAVKPVKGTRGSGFAKLSCSAGQLQMNGDQVSRESLLSFLSRANYWVVTEFLHPHVELGKIWAGAVNTVRVVAYRHPDDRTTRIAGAYIKFGTSVTGVIDNVSAGGISANINIENGEYGDGRYFINNRMENATLHPDTKMPIEGVLPLWQEIKATLGAIGDYLPQLVFMGYDIAVGDDGFKIIEINSLPAIDTLNYYHPIQTDPSLNKLFSKQKELPEIEPR